MRPTSTWTPEEEIVDHYGMLLPADLPTGKYTVAVGLYDPGERSAPCRSAPDPGDYAVELGPVQVSAIADAQLSGRLGMEEYVEYCWNDEFTTSVSLSK